MRTSCPERRLQVGPLSWLTSMAHEMLVAAATFLTLMVAALGSLAISHKLPARYHNDETTNIIRLTGNIFVVASSLVLGLLLNSAKNSFGAVDRNVHVLATELILLDRTLRQYGPETSVAREHLVAYVRSAVDGTWRTGGQPIIEDRAAERLLDDVGRALATIRPADPGRAELWREAQTSYQSVVKQRWVLIEQSDEAIPAPFLAMLVTWLTLVFASYGYRAARNPVVVASLVAAALLLAASMYLILDMDKAFAGTIRVSPAPLERVVEQLQR